MVESLVEPIAEPIDEPLIDGAIDQETLETAPEEIVSPGSPDGGANTVEAAAAEQG